MPGTASSAPRIAPLPLLWPPLIHQLSPAMSLLPDGALHPGDGPRNQPSFLLQSSLSRKLVLTARQQEALQYFVRPVTLKRHTEAEPAFLFSVESLFTHSSLPVYKPQSRLGLYPRPGLTPHGIRLMTCGQHSTHSMHSRAQHQHSMHSRAQHQHSMHSRI